MANLKSWLFAAGFCAGCTALSAYFNLTHSSMSTVPTRLNWLIELHIGTALLGAMLFALFVVGTPAALRGPASASSYGVGMVPRIGAVRYFIPGNGAFFSVARIVQILGVIVCLMIQFIYAEPLGAGNDAQEGSGRPVKLLKRPLTA
ncbi:hypothetical protein E1N52_40260 [Paraburkholderia guartelaensis]|uniref:Uncharacterized protein n=1 Tax=Paraburkholderia guartelaensis TaxID=2546446 RepID=A0A4R5L1F9_9BURK|nr:hypothetical protein [Paraburkholderia guartelaensis]TDG02329.1 hypothetical protein E1N52_40260 [Paraburkholderia guartelaensis]